MIEGSKKRLPHPFPYQGSKRAIAHHILPYIPTDVGVLYEPFCGAAAVSIAVASSGLASRFHLNDLNSPLMALWKEILNHPAGLADSYGQLWEAQEGDRKRFFFSVREQFNRSHKPHHLLYLLARIVKGSVRYNAHGKFNQSADNRRSGMRPTSMKQQILSVSALLAGRTTTSSTDFRNAIADAKPNDLVYMDPPYQGTSFTRDHRYFGGLGYEEFADALNLLNGRGISYIVSYDGYTGNKMHGKQLPGHLNLRHLEIRAGRSSQATLLGSNDETVESLYLSPALVTRLKSVKRHFVLTPHLKNELVWA